MTLTMTRILAPTQHQVASDERSAAASCMLALVDPARARALTRRSARPLACDAAPDANAAVRELRRMLGARAQAADRAEYFLRRRERSRGAALQSVAVRVPAFWLGFLALHSPDMVERCLMKAGTMALGVVLVTGTAGETDERARLLAAVGQQLTTDALSPPLALRLSDRAAPAFSAALSKTTASLVHTGLHGTGLARGLGTSLFAHAWQRMDPSDAALLGDAAMWNAPAVFDAATVRFELDSPELWSLLLRVLDRAVHEEARA